ncbi:MAG: hypothetical protein AAB289_12875, partial [Chloroflexota bacterium]
MNTPEAASYLSDGNVFTAGVVVTPTDIAPEKDAGGQVPAGKQALGVTRNRLMQGDGTTALSPDPVAMLRVSFSVSGSTSLTSDLAALRLTKTGLLYAAHVAELGLFYDENANGTYDALADVILGTAAWDGTAWAFGRPDPPYNLTPLNLVDPARTHISSGARTYFVAVRIASAGYTGGELPSSLGLSIPSPSYVVFSTDSLVGAASNNFSLMTATSPVEREPANIRVQGEDIAAWWQPPTLPISSYSYVDQGKSNVGMLKLKMWTDAYTGTIGSVRVAHTGTGSDSDITRVRLYVDTGADGNPAGGDGVFQYAVDKEITDPAGAAVFVSRSTDLVLNIDGGSPYNTAQRTVTVSTITYFVAFDFHAAASMALTHGAQVTASDVVPLAGDGVVSPFSAIDSRLALMGSSVTIPGCSTVKNVKKDGSGDHTAIQAAVNALATSLSGDACVVIRDTGTYSEQVTVQGFTTNGYRLKIMADPSFVSSAPVVSPPALSTAAFRILNASVTIQNIAVRPAAGITYGIQVSSAYVALSGVSVDGGGNIWNAGVMLSSYSSLNNSSITVQNALGLEMRGIGADIFRSSAQANGGLAAGLRLSGASSNTLTSLFSYNPAGPAVILDYGASFNLISSSTFISEGSGYFALRYQNGSSSNVFTRGFITASGYGVALIDNSNSNVISLSTVTGA